MTKKKSPEQFRMSFTGHLEELRKRVVICLVALLVGMGISYGFRDQLFAFILQPLFLARQSVDNLPGQSQVDEGPRTAAELAADAQKMSKRALATDDQELALKRVAKAVTLAAKAVEAVENAEEIRAERERRRQQRSIAYTDPTKPFWVSLQLALVGGICLAFGVILWEIWAFVAPGLYPREKKYAAPFIISATLCFVGGAGFGYRFVFPIGFTFLTRFSREIANSQAMSMMDVTTVDSFVGIALKLLLAFGLVFELPVVVSFLALAGIVDHKQLWRFGRYFVVIAVCIGALLTPPDVISQIMMAIPMSVLYLVSIGLAYFLHPRGRKRREALKKKAEEEKARKKEEAAAKAQAEEDGASYEVDPPDRDRSDDD